MIFKSDPPSHVLHVWNIYLHLGHLRVGKCGKYYIHGASGLVVLPEDVWLVVEPYPSEKD